MSEPSHYLVLDRNDTKKPVWVLAAVERRRRARLDAAGRPVAGEWIAAMEWVNRSLGAVGWLAAVVGCQGYACRVTVEDYQH